MAIERSLIALDPGKIDLGTEAPLRFRRHLPGERGESDADRRLIESVARHGVIQPPLLAGSPYAASASFIVIQGCRRIAAARTAGFDSVNTLIIPDNLVSKREIAVLWLEGIPFGEPPSELERIYLTRRAAEFLGSGGHTQHGGRTPPEIPDEGMRPPEGLSTGYGRELSPEFLARLWKLLGLEEDVLESLHRGEVSTGDLLLLSEHPFVDTAEAVRLLGGEGLNRREQKEAVRLMLRLGDHGGDAWMDFTKDYRSSGRSLLEALGAACHPALTRDLERIGRIIRDIHLPPGAAIQPPGNLEGGSYLLSMRIREEERLAEAIKKLQDALDEGRIRSLIRILAGEE